MQRISNKNCLIYNCLTTTIYQNLDYCLNNSLVDNRQWDHVLPSKEYFRDLNYRMNVFNFFMCPWIKIWKVVNFAIKCRNVEILLS